MVIEYLHLITVPQCLHDRVRDVHDAFRPRFAALDSVVRFPHEDPARKFALLYSPQPNGVILSWEDGDWGDDHAGSRGKSLSPVRGYGSVTLDLGCSGSITLVLGHGSSVALAVAFMLRVGGWPELLRDALKGLAFAASFGPDGTPRSVRDVAQAAPNKRSTDLGCRC
ncbi:hypothetical protein GSI_14062 [Ganoderma sinense ZZ0214-1]|uniref:Uncharacterized protein n=1 Tax=Ganoderma sinense ZZ0214-1 TaxID=1077348 RepID=A0A2G8RS20_9APHY|nr:hypothetical protein GSI_14062 [Ganoderma sinense ZZ0214-1]